MSTAIHRAPPLALMSLEPWRAMADLVRGKLTPTPALPQGRGEPILVIPGLATNHLATALLRQKLTELNYQACDWGQGINKGPDSEDLAGWLAPLADKLEALTASTGKKAHLIGWSLGGIAARELAKMRPHHVAKVVTLGTPFAGTDEATNAGWAYELMHGGQKIELSPALSRQLLEEPPVPTVSVYSKSDGIVSWTACVQPKARRTRHVEVQDVGHFGLVLSPKVLALLAHELARPARSRFGLPRSVA